MIKLDFEESAQISAGAESDILVVNLWGYFQFVSEAANIPIAPDSKIELELRRQQIPSPAIFSVENVAQITLYTMVFSFVFKYFFQ